MGYNGTMNEHGRKVRSMDQQMRYFIAVVDRHSFTAAALDNNISQSAISQQVKELENNLGVKLLERKGRSFTVTPAGEYFYRQAQQIVKQLDQLRAETQRIARGSEQYVLHLGYLRNFGTQEFLQALAEFSKQYPNVEVKITSGMHEELFKLLRSDRVDLNFSDQRRALSDEYNNRLLTETDFMAVVSSSKFADREKITTAELADLPCILVVNPQQAGEEEDYYRDILGIHSAFRVVSTFGEAQALVVANQGYILVNGRTKDLIDPQLSRILPLYNGKRPLHQKYYAYWKKDNSGYYIEAFADKLAEQFQK